MLFFKKKFFPIKTTIFVHKENSYYTMNHTVEDLSLFNALRNVHKPTVQNPNNPLRLSGLYLPKHMDFR